MSDFGMVLDKFFESSLKVADRIFDTKVADSEAKAQANARAAEEARLKQLEIAQKLGFSDDMATVNAFGYSFPSWVLPAAAIAFGGIILLKKVK